MHVKALILQTFRHVLHFTTMSIRGSILVVKRRMCRECLQDWVLWLRLSFHLKLDFGPFSKIYLSASGREGEIWC